MTFERDNFTDLIHAILKLHVKRPKLSLLELLNTVIKSTGYTSLIIPKIENDGLITSIESILDKSK